MIDANGTAWLPLEIVTTYQVMIWAVPQGKWAYRWYNPQSYDGNIILVDRTGATNITAWCPDGPTRIWSNWGCADQIHNSWSWHPDDRGTDFKRSGWSYDYWCSQTRDDHYRFQSGTGTCRWVAPTPTPTPVPFTITPIQPVHHGAGQGCNTALLPEPLATGGDWITPATATTLNWFGNLPRQRHMAGGRTVDHRLVRLARPAGWCIGRAGTTTSTSPQP